MIKCWYFRRRILSSVDENLPLPANAQRHLEHCAACRERYELETRIARRLTSTARAETQRPPPFLHSRIMASLAEIQIQTAGPRVVIRRLGWAAGVGAVCVTLTAVLWLRNARSPGEPGQSLAAGNPFSLALPDQAQLREWTSKLDEPLEDEMRLVYRDSTNAVNSLAKNFLPDQFRSSLFALGQN